MPKYPPPASSFGKTRLPLVEEERTGNAYPRKSAAVAPKRPQGRPTDGPRSPKPLKMEPKWLPTSLENQRTVGFHEKCKTSQKHIKNKHFQEFVRLKNHDFSIRSALKTLSQRRTSQKGVRVTTLVPQNALMDVIRTIFDPKGSPTDPAGGGQMNVGSVCKTCKSSFSARSHPLPQNVCSGGGPPRGKR